MESLRIVLLADTHLGFDLPARPRVERRRRGEDFFANFERVLRHARERRPAAFVHGGDFFHGPGVHSAVVDRAYRGLASVADDGVPVVIVPGNHERSRLPGSIWLGHRNIHVLDRPRTVVIDTGPARIAFGGFPFLRGDLQAAFAAGLDETALGRESADLRFLCLHQSVAGASVGPSGFTFRPGRDVIARRHLPRDVTAVLAGHVHRAQVLTGDGRPPVYYPGAIERTSVAERDESKGFFELTVACGTGGDWALAEAAFVELPTRPMIDLVLPAGLEPDGVAAYLEGRARALDPQSVVRVTSGAGLTAAACLRVTAAALRVAFPPTMNVYLSRDLARAAQ